jgi:hypothetical protein
MAPASRSTLAPPILPLPHAPALWHILHIRCRGTNQMERELSFQANHASIHTKGRHERPRPSGTAGARAIKVEADPAVAPLEHLGLQLLP